MQGAQLRGRKKNRLSQGKMKIHPEKALIAFPRT